MVDGLAHNVDEIATVFAGESCSFSSSSSLFSKDLRLKLKICYIMLSMERIS